ncbi:hypothetical protein QTP88_014933 [Uroleucon formosanum]
MVENQETSMSTLQTYCTKKTNGFSVDSQTRTPWTTGPGTADSPLWAVMTVQCNTMYDHLRFSRKYCRPSKKMWLSTVITIACSSSIHRIRIRISGRTSLKISGDQNTTIAEMLPTFVKPAYVRSGGRRSRWFGL